MCWCVDVSDWKSLRSQTFELLKDPTSTPQHMNVPFTNLKIQYNSIKADIDQAIQSVFESGQFIGGTIVEKFEKDFGDFHKADNCVAVGNGTDAILIALKALGLQSGDEVIVPAFGQISASEMVTMAGGKPIFCDVLPSGTIDFNSIELSITSRTKGVIAVHLYGQAAHVHEMRKICERHALFLIEDCAQAHLTSEWDIPVGTIGEAGTFSFYPTKNLGAYGDGGCILTQDNALTERMRLFANHGGPHRHLLEGINSRLDPLQAAMLSVKCFHLQRWTEKRIEHAAHYFEMLKYVNEIVLPEVRMNTTHTFHQFVIRSTHRDQLKEFLSDNGIQTMIHYPVALHNLPAYKHLGLKPGDFPEATRCQEQVLSLPVYPELLPEQISYVCENIITFFKAR
jgi:dTDP-4-amino-4,6-dideoxygalactose transaminase